MENYGAGREDIRGTIGTTAAESEPSWQPRPKPPEDAPNVVVILFDDTGFSHFGCYGSDIETPNIDRLAAGGLRYTNFHTTALCSPTRACLLTGRNHHSVGMRFLCNVDTGFANCRGVINPKAATIPEILRSQGYGTFALGKWHLANMEDCSPAGPFDHWPLQRGFDRYYGFLGGATDQFSPELVVDNRPIDPPSHEGYHITEDLIDQAISMIGAHQSSAPGRKFFTYIALGATHSPHQAPKEYIDKYKGRYDKGWDVTREEWFAKQLELGIVPEGTELAPRNPGVEPWDSLSDDQKKVYARMQEAFAGFLDHTDAQIGRLMDFLETQNLMDDTLIVLMSDNGASQEGGVNGTLNELAFFNRMDDTVEDMVEKIDTIGGRYNFNNYPWGWAQAGNTPLRFYKRNTYEGGIRDPLVVHWPKGIADPGGIRDQYHHVIDVLPTLLDCIGVEAPKQYKGIPQMPIEGTSFRYTFPAEAKGLPTTRRSQYYEMLGNRAIWADGWKAVTLHEQGTPFDEEQWDLYHTDSDFSECKNLAEQEPEKLRQMIELWWTEAGRYNVLPLDDRLIELFTLRRPDSEQPDNRQRFLPGMPHLDRFKIPDLRNRSFEIMARAVLSENAEGVIMASGCRNGGSTLYIQNEKLVFEYNYLGKPWVVASTEPLPNGTCELGVRYRKMEDNKGIASLLANVDGKEQIIGEGPVETLPARQTLFGMDFGKDTGPTVSTAYKGPFPFTGKLEWVEFVMENDRDDLKEAAGVEMENMLAEQ